ncbi:hypothetical protein QVD17_24850 [Tagetes erecta]|uniref:Uncharacterized protein n=1 Tax=Tagetes erecta TaxID=13708 RepID=A0AAD8NUZ2_TARER|nr:hypothetical protein QVD17_24850 [Tagetes erecta]
MVSRQARQTQRPTDEVLRITQLQPSALPDSLSHHCPSLQLQPIAHHATTVDRPPPPRPCTTTAQRLSHLKVYF